MMLQTIVVLFFLAVTKAAQVSVQWNERLVLPGQNATFLCRVNVPLQYCRIEIPGMRVYNLNKKVSVDNEVMYYGDGLDAGHCGVTINRVEEKNNGNVKCTLGVESEATESFGVMQLIVAKAPKQPELDISKGTDSVRVYRVGEVLQASCIVRDGRPAANISWYLDDEAINDNSLKMPTVVDMAKENLQSKLQNLTKTLQPSDNGKYLRCVAFHPAYTEGFQETKRQLDVKFPPLPIRDNLDKFGYQIGRVGLINLTIEANPKPRIDWSVAGQKISAGSTDNTGRIEAEDLRDLGRGRYEANLRIAAIKKEDTETDYILTAYNDMGTEQYKMKISTSPEPEGLEFGVGAIIGVVVVILLVILLVSMLIFAKMTRRWCFSGEDDIRHIGESSDTESADVRPTKDTKINIPPIKLTSLFKKSKDKVASESVPEKKQMDVTEESKGDEEKEEETEKKETREKDERGLVYAELDLVRAELKPVVKNDDEKTEYAEIVYTQANDEGDEKESAKK